MSHMLVKTLENGETLLSTVPVQWVVEKGRQKTLYWPNSKTVDKLRKNAHSVPDLKTWTQTPCTIINRNLESFQEGLALEKNLSGFSDTEDEENEKFVRATRRIHPRTSSINFNNQVEKATYVVSGENNPQQLHFNRLKVPQNQTMSQQTSTVEELSQVPNLCRQQIQSPLATYHIMPQTSSTPEPSRTSNSNIPKQKQQPSTSILSQSLLNSILTEGNSQILNISDINQGSEIINLYEEDNGQYVDENKNDLSSSISRIEANQTKILSEIEILKKSQIHISNSMTTIMTQHSEMIRLLSTGNTNGHIEEENFTFQPISTVEDLLIFDKKLEDMAFMSKVTSYLAKICGTSGKRNGWDVSYKVIDHYITRQVMQLCQWTKCGGKDKPALIIFSNVHRCFFNAILLADSKYTFEENQKFFKAVCKNSKRRLEEKLCKTSEGEHTKRSKVAKRGLNNDGNIAEENLDQNIKNTEDVLISPTGGNICDVDNISISVDIPMHNNISDVEMVNNNKSK